MLKQLHSILFLLFLCISFSMDAKVVVDKFFTRQNIIPQCEIFVDSTALIPVDEIIQNNVDLFRNTNASMLNYGFFSGNVWIKLDIENFTQSNKPLYLLCNNKIVESVAFYPEIKNPLEINQHSGLLVSYSQKAVIDEKAVFRLDLLPYQRKTVYMKIHVEDFAFWQDITLMSSTEYLNSHTIRNFFNGLIYGVVIIFILINLFYYITIKKKAFLYFVLYQLSMLFYLFGTDGLIFQFIFTESSSATIKLYYIASVLPQLLVIPFTSISLKVAQYKPMIHKLLIGFLVFFTCFMILSVFNKSMPLRYLNILSFITLILVFGTSILMLKNKNLVLPKFFIVALSPLIIILILFLFRNTGLINISISITYIKVGVLIQLIFLSFGLSIVFRRFMKDASKEAIQNLENLNRVKDDLNNRLEVCVSERTAELDKAVDDLNRVNTEIVDINKSLSNERNKFENQKEILEQQKKELTDSIAYAERLQKMLMITDEDLRSLFSDQFFALSLPKDIISGDFYWAGKIGTKTIITVADCTGHGVPGAFMSVIGITYLRDIVENKRIVVASEILNHLRQRVAESFRKHSNDENMPKDGMDLALVVIDNENKTIEFSGAYNPLYLIRWSELKIYKADHLSIGIDDRNGISFSSNTIEYNPGDIIYLFSDGFVDQFGWRTGKKFKQKQFRELLLEISELPLEVQKAVLVNTMNNWKGDLEQVDDITVLGVKLF